jgi:hypothetical protein
MSIDEVASNQNHILNNIQLSHLTDDITRIYDGIKFFMVLMILNSQPISKAILTVDISDTNEEQYNFL